MHPGLLTRKIKSCISWDEVGRIHHLHRAELNAIHVAAMLSHLAQTCPDQGITHPTAPPAFQTLLAALLDLALRHLPSYTQREVANILWAASKLGPPLEPPWTAAFLEAARRLAPGLRPQHTANLLYAVALLKLPVSDAWLGDVLRHAAPGVPAFKPQELSNTLWALGELRLDPAPVEFVSACLAAALRQPDACRPQHWAMQAVALVRLRLAPAPEWQAQYFAATLPQLAYFNPQDLANVLWATATLGVRPSREWLSFACAAAARLMPVLQPRHCSLLLWALTKHQCRPRPSLLAQVMLASYENLASYSALDLVLLLWSLARLRYMPGRVWLAAALKRAGGLLEGMKNQEVALLSWSLGELGVQTSEAFGRCLMVVSKPRFATCSPQVLANVVHGLLNQGHTLPATYIASFLGASKRLLPDASHRELLSYVYSLHRCGAVPPRSWLVVCFQRLVQVAEQLGKDERGMAKTLLQRWAGQRLTEGSWKAQRRAQAAAGGGLHSG